MNHKRDLFSKLDNMGLNTYFPLNFNAFKIKKKNSQ